MTKPRQPGDVFLDRYMPNATQEQREEARQNLYEFFAALAAIAARRTAADHETAIRANGNGTVDSESGALQPL